MKIKISRKQWEEAGIKAGLLKKASSGTGRQTMFTDPKNPLLGTDLGGKTRSQIDEFMKNNGYYLVREVYPFGSCPTYISNDGKQVLYVLINASDIEEEKICKIVSWEEIKKFMLDCWRPHSQDDQRWRNENLLGSQSSNNGDNEKFYKINPLPGSSPRHL